MLGDQYTPDKKQQDFPLNNISFDNYSKMSQSLTEEINPMLFQNYNNDQSTSNKDFFNPDQRAGDFNSVLSSFNGYNGSMGQQMGTIVDKMGSEKSVLNGRGDINDFYQLGYSTNMHSLTPGFNDPSRQNFITPIQQNFIDPIQQNFINPMQQNFNDSNHQNFNDHNQPNFKDSNQQNFNTTPHHSFNDHNQANFSDTARQNFTDFENSPLINASVHSSMMAGGGAKENNQTQVHPNDQKVDIGNYLPMAFQNNSSMSSPIFYNPSLPGISNYTSSPTVYPGKQRQKSKSLQSKPSPKLKSLSHRR
ncbi:hypothetical protein AYI68_g5844 [Smittium mucronatum]|uniref:Uncharacterized protein n=1 Tax=Smittium mucronatum TaxID=133383 RepID=A0A1R0GT62_9FUNG|nr:hypothetical protein AYI68_g5844 [Smittium mucronatum]